MDELEKILNDNDFKSLNIDSKRRIIQSFYDKKITTDKDFGNLSSEQQGNVKSKLFNRIGIDLTAEAKEATGEGLLGRIFREGIKEPASTTAGAFQSFFGNFFNQLENISNKISEKTGLSKGTLFGDLANFYSEQGKSLTEKGIKPGASETLHSIIGSTVAQVGTLLTLGPGGLPIMGGIGGASEAIEGDKNVLAGAAKGATHGALMLAIFKGLNLLPRTSRGVTATGIFGGENITNELKKDPADRDWKDVAANTASMTVLTLMGGKGKSLGQIKKDLIRSSASDINKAAVQLEKQFGKSKPIDIIKRTTAEVTPVEIKNAPAQTIKSVQNGNKILGSSDVEVIPKDKPVAEIDVANTVKKVSQLVKTAKSIIPKISTERTAELGKRIAKAAPQLERVKGKEFGGKKGKFEAISKTKSALGGELPKGTFEPPENSISTQEINSVYDKIIDYGSTNRKDYFFRVDASIAMNKVLSGQIPGRAGIDKLETVFGKEFVAPIKAKRPLSTKIYEGVLETLNVPRTLLTTFDLSYSLRQGAMLVPANPKIAFGAFKSQLKAFGSSQAAFEVDNAIRNGKYANLKDRVGLRRSATDARLFTGEEQFRSSLAKRIPGFGRVISATERAATTYINKLRSDVFDYHANKWEGTGKTLEDYRQLADFVNKSTGWGNIGKLDNVNTIMNATFFSPRFSISRIQAPFTAFTADAPTRKIIASNLVAFVGAGLSALGLAALAGASVETDPRSADFGKGKIGNTRVDFWAGEIQIARLVAQMITGQRKPTGRVEPDIKEADRFDTVLRFLQTKLAPVPGLALDIIKGETFVGDKLKPDAETIKEQAFQRMVPLVIQDVADAIRFQGLEAGVAVTLPATLGISVQTYKENEGTKIANYKDLVSREAFGRKWNDLTKPEQDKMNVNHPEIEEMEVKRSFERKDKSFDPKVLQSQKEVGNRIRGKLPQNIKDETNRVLLTNVFGVGRRILSNWYLNDERYKRYEELTSETVNDFLTRVVSRPEYAKLSDKRQRLILIDAIQKAKEVARAKLIKESNRNK